MVKIVPIKWKYGRVFDREFKNGNLGFGNLQYLRFGLVALKDVECFYEQLFAVQKVLKKFFKKRVNIKFNVAVTVPFTKKAVSSRMGKGKGQRKGFKALVRKGTLLIEISNISEKESFFALKQCSLRLPGLFKVVKFNL